MGVPIETMEKVFFASIAHDRAGTRGGARDATSDLGHAPRRSSRLPSLGLSRSRRPAGLAPWGAGLGACGVEGGRKGSRGQSQSRVVSGQRFWQPPLGVVSVGRDSRSEDAAPGRKRAGGGGCGITHVLLLRSLLGHRLELFHCGVGGYGWVPVSAGVGEGWQARAGGARVRSIPRHLVFRRSCKSAPANEQSGGFRAVDSLSIRAFVAASMSPPYFLSMATTSSSPWPVIEQSV